jgi:hypothetical protein
MAAICFFLIILASATVLLFESQYDKSKAAVETESFGVVSWQQAPSFLCCS